MATLQTLRNKGPLLIIAVGIALLAFIAGDAFKLFESNSYETTVGTVGEEEVSIQEFEQFRNDYGVYCSFQDKFSTNLGLPVQEKNGEEIRNLTWSLLASEKMVYDRAKELGIEVTSEEINYVLANVPEIHRDLLQQEYPCPFANPVIMGTFDVNALGSFLDQYAQLQSEGEVTQEFAELYTYWKVLERKIKLNLTAMKLSNVYGISTIANKAVADKEIKLGNDSINAEIAKFPIISYMDSVKVSDEEIAEYYNKNIRYRKEWHNLNDSRAVKYAYIKVTPSDEDRENTRIAMQACTDSLRNGYDNYSRLATKTQSEELKFTDIYLASEELFTDIPEVYQNSVLLLIPEKLDPALASRINSAAVNEVFDPQLVRSNQNVNEYYYYVIKNREIHSVPKELTLSYAIITHDNKETLDANVASLVDSLNNGGNFAKLTEGYATKHDSIKFATNRTLSYGIEEYNQRKINSYTGQEVSKEILAGAALSNVMENDTIQLNILNSSTDEYQAMNLPSGKKLVFKVHEKSNDSINIYKPIIMRRKIVYSDKTYNNELNEFNKFVGGCKNISELEANIKKSEKYNITGTQILNDLSYRIYLNEPVNLNSEMSKLILDENLEVGSLTKVIKCGNSNTTFMVDEIEDNYNKGYMPLTQNFGNGATLYDLVKAEVLKEKATAKLIEDVKKKSESEMTYTPILGIEYGQPVQVAPNIQDIVLSAVAAKLNVGEKSAPFCGKNIMSGEDYVYVVKVTEKTAKKENKLDMKGVHDRARLLADPSAIFKVLTEKNPTETNFRKF